MTQDFRTAPVDERSAATLAAKGLEFRLIDRGDRDAMERYVQAEMRGFLGSTMSQGPLDAHVAEFGENRRNVAVYDPHGADPLAPIATTNAWPGPVTLPGGREIDAWAVSGVTVAPTHRRRGIQRQLMEGELRTARDLGLPMAMLTVSESSIYGRYGYGVAALAAEIKVSTRCLTWTGPQPDGRLDFVTVREWRDAAAELFERTRLRHPGEVRPFPLRWDQAAGFVSEDGDKSASRRAIQYRDAAGAVRGLALYKVDEGTTPEDFTAHEAQIITMIAETDDAYAALWRCFIEMDLVTTIRYDLGTADEPVRWMVSNFRAVEVKPFDMQYLRILDVPRVLEARGYEAPGEVSFEVSDDLGFAVGAWRLRSDGSAATVEPAAGAPDVSLRIVELSSIVLGGVSVETLRAAGRIREHTPGAARTLAQVMSTSQTPAISSWY